MFGRKTTCSTLYLVLEADSKNWNNDRQWLNQNELKEFSPGWSSVLKKLLPHTFAPPQTTLFIVHRCLKRQSCNMHLIEVFQLCWSCPTCVIPADVPRSGSARQPASSWLLRHKRPLEGLWFDPYPLKNEIWGGGVVLKFHFKIPFLH